MLICSFEGVRVRLTPHDPSREAYPVLAGKPRDAGRSRQNGPAGACTSKVFFDNWLQGPLPWWVPAGTEYANCNVRVALGRFLFLCQKIAIVEAWRDPGPSFFVTESGIVEARRVPATPFFSKKT